MTREVVSIACPGDCCDGFPLSDVALATLTASPTHWANMGYQGDELLKVLDLIERVDFAPVPGWEATPTDNRVTCRYFKADRTCGNYADRPGMCSAYPYGGECVYCSAGVSLGSPGRWVPVELTGIFTPLDYLRAGIA